MRTAADIRRANSFAVVRSIHAHGDLSRREVADLTGLSFATVATICTELLDRGLLVEASRARAAAGRPTAKLALNASHGILLGVDIAETYVHVETLDAALDRLSATRLEIEVHQRRPREVVARVGDAILAELDRHPGRELLGVGVSAPGQVDQVGGTSVFAPNWNWHNVPLLDLIRSVVDAPLFLDNPLKSLAIAELWMEPARHEQTFMVVNLGTGVGAGIAIDGRLLRGSTNSAGEWGHTALIAEGRSCRCGSRGCVEAYVGAPGILQTLREHAPGSALNRGDDQTATVEALAEAAQAGDPVALEIIERTAQHLGTAIASAINFLNPDAVILGGWVAGALGDHLLERVRPHIRSHALAVPLMAAKLELQHPRGNSVSLGAAAFALERYLDSVPDSTSESLPAPPHRRLG